MKLIDRDLQTITGALRVAAEVYDRDAATAAAAPGHDGVRVQFERQARDARELAERINGETDVDDPTCIRF